MSFNARSSILNQTYTDTDNNNDAMHEDLDSDGAGETDPNRLDFSSLPPGEEAEFESGAGGEADLLVQAEKLMSLPCVPSITYFYIAS